MLSDMLIARALFPGGGESGGGATYQPKVINLCDHGINAWTILAKGNGVHTISVEGQSLFNEVPPVGTDLILTNIDGVNYPVTINNSVVAYNASDGSPMQVCFTLSGMNMGFMIKADIMIVDAGADTLVYADVKYTTAS